MSLSEAQRIQNLVITVEKVHGKKRNADLSFERLL